MVKKVLMQTYLWVLLLLLYAPILIIVNNGAGTGQAHRVWNETQCLLRGYKIKYEAHMTRYEGHAAKLAEQISRVKGEEPVNITRPAV